MLLFYSNILLYVNSNMTKYYHILTERGYCMTTREIFLDNLSKIIEERNESFYSLAKNTMISQSAFYSWKNRNVTPTIDKVAAICEYLNVSADKLLGLPEPEPPDFTNEEIYLIECFRRADNVGKEMIRRTCTCEGNVKNCKIIQFRGKTTE